MTLQWETRGNLRGPAGADGADGGTTPHAARHATGGDDPLTPAAIGASATGHAHAGADITSGTVAYLRLPVGVVANTVAAGDDSRLTDARTPVAHNHSGADITSGTVAYARLPVGTAASTVAAGDDSRITGAVQATRQVLAGNGLVGGGALSGDVTLSASYSASTPAAVAAAGSAGAANTLARSDHAHAGVPTSRTVTGTGALTGGGDLSANRTLDVASGGITGSHLAAALADPAAGTAGLRTLGTGAAQAAAGDHAHAAYATTTDLTRQTLGTVTAVKTANYTASPGELVMVNAASGPVTIFLPAVSGGGPVGVKKIDNTANVVTVQRAGSDTIGAQAATTTTLQVQYQIAEFRPSATAGNWAITGGQLSIIGLDARYRQHNQVPRTQSVSGNANVDVGAPGDLQVTVTGGTPTLTPTNGVNGRTCLVECLASGAERTVAIASSVVLTTGIASRDLIIPSGQRGVFLIRYTTLGTPEYSLVSAYRAQ
jgi:hypothetical protein